MDTDDQELWGLYINATIGICETLKLALNEGFKFVCAPLFHPRFKREFSKTCKNRGGPLSRPDLVLQSSEWRSLVAGRISDYLNADSEKSSGQAQSAMQQEISYANHLNLPAIIISLKNSRCSNLARLINSNLSEYKPYQVWVKVPLINHYEESLKWRSDVDAENKEEREEKCTWEWWNIFIALCNYDKRLGIMLEITKTLPSQEEIKRWMAEPIRCIILSTSIFLTNKKGYPVLSKAHQIVIKKLFHLNIQIVISGNIHHGSFNSYLKYMNHLWQQAQGEISSMTDNDLPENNIVHPLQPLADNLVSNVYELFEKDSVKYREYGKAVFCALSDKIQSGKNDNEIIQVMIVGAGRGPLVSVTLEAAKKAQREIKIYAVEKNQFAVVTLKTLKEELWGDSVEIIAADVRKLNFPRTIDILISELLGSFGDNELAPEVLDGAQKFLKNGGCSIPQSYTSFICPVQGSEIYSDLKESSEKKDCEMPYVDTGTNTIFQKHSLCSHFTIQTIVNFSGCPIDNSRYKNLAFGVNQNSVLHGFSGFFKAILYGETELSIVPGMRTPGLSSWNPIFFPLHEPVYLKAGNEIRLHFWRLTGSSKVWYEWTIVEPIPLQIHNSNGRSSSMSLT